MILIDTSCWIEALRERGNIEIRRRLHVAAGAERDSLPSGRVAGAVE